LISNAKISVDAFFVQTFYQSVIAKAAILQDVIVFTECSF